MSKRVVEFFVVDIFVAMDKISRYQKDFDDAESFYYDEKSFDATMRELQIIGESTKHLLNSKIVGEEYRVIVDFRNLIVHEYFGIDAKEIWNILHQELPSFRKILKDTIHKLDREKLLEVISGLKEDSRGKTATFLQNLPDELFK